MSSLGLARVASHRRKVSHFEGGSEEGEGRGLRVEIIGVAQPNVKTMFAGLYLETEIFSLFFSFFSDLVPLIKMLYSSLFVSTYSGGNYFTSIRGPIMKKFGV